MTIRNALSVVAGSAAVSIFDATFSTFLPAPWSSFHPSLLLVSLFIIRESPQLAILSAVVSGMFLDAFSFSQTFALARLLVVSGALWFFTRRVLTNHSVYAALAIVFAARAIDQLLRALVQSAMHAKAPSLLVAPMWQMMWTSGLWDAAIVCMLFTIQAFLHRRFLSLPRQGVE